MTSFVRYHPSGETEGVDPSAISSEDFEQGGHVKTALLTVIRRHCIDCCNSASEARKCVAVRCNLWPYRTGINPFREKRVMTEEQRQAAAERLRKAKGGGSRS